MNGINVEAVRLSKSLTLCRYLTELLSAVVLLGGCQGPDKPRLRWGAFFGSPFGMSFPDPSHLGEHHFEFSLTETDGMVYTCKGGFIDIGHVREAADRTAYLSRLARKNLLAGKKEFRFNVIEPSEYWVTLSYPPGWNRLSRREKEKTVNEISIPIGQYLAHTTLIWHEIVTWYGFATAGIFPDTISSFSPEDTYSDLLGTRLAVKALRDKDEPYDVAMTKLLNEKLQELDVQPASVAREAGKDVDGKWYTGGFYFFVKMKRRNFDIGLNDNCITPWLVPGICPDAVAEPLPVPELEAVCAQGFDVHVQLDPRVFEKDKIYHSIHLARDRRIRPQVDFPRIMAQIEGKGSQPVVSVAAR
jgi:Protein of unknown function (DUF4056)